MIFILKKQPVFELIAICESEEEQWGFRDEGDRVRIKLKNKITRLQFEYLPKKIHPDIVALVCYCAFYPFLKKSVTFPLDISLNAKRLFERFYLQEKREGTLENRSPVKVRNASAAVVPYKGVAGKSLLSFGGGMDSTAVSLVFPEFSLVNQYENFEQLLSMRGLYKKIRQTNPSTSCYSFYTNIRALTVPEGNPSWTCSHLCTLLMSMDYKTATICTGGVFGSKFMGGKDRKFIKAATVEREQEVLHSDGHFRNWGILFLGIGIRSMDPVGGLSGVLTAKVVYEKGLGESVLYCQRNEGSPCHRCPKCFTKNLALEYWEYRGTGELRDSEYWDQYGDNDISEYVEYLFKTTSHITGYLTANVPVNNKPEWFKRRVRNMTRNAEWVGRIYPGMLSCIPQFYRSLLRERLRAYGLEFMKREEVELLAAYNLEGLEIG